MTPVTLEGFLSKKQIEASYGRSYRSLTRDITRAVRTGNADILQHLKLVTENDQVREGTDVTLELIQDLSNHGLRPTWLAERSWVAEWCARQRLGPRRRSGQDAPFDQAGSIPIAPAPTLDVAAAVPLTSPATVEMLQQRINDQKQQIDLLRGQLQIKDEQIRTANQLAGESQQLMRDLHVLLKNVQDGLLGEGTRHLIPARTAAARQPSPAIHPPVEPSEPPADTQPHRTPGAPTHEQALHDTAALSKSKVSRPSRKGTRPGRNPTTQTKRPLRRPPAGCPSQPRPTTSRQDKRPPSFVDKYLPTLDRAVRSLFRR